MQKEKITTGSGLVLLVEKEIRDGVAEITISTDGGAAVLLHWGMRGGRDPSWQLPPEQFWPEGSHAFDSKAVRSPFIRKGDLFQVTIPVESSTGFRSIDFVLFFTGDGRWDNNMGKNYRIKIPGPPTPYETSLGGRDAEEIAEEIIEHETSRNSWTLMHRFNLCYDLLDKAKHSEEGLALIFVWLRYSFLRQLDWQRNYNTKPRELGHAMDRLTVKLAGIYSDTPAARGMIRLIMTTLGRGSDAQRVRDEVLNIMHRRHIKEVSGHFMEEWHQKLHNNTTPDDIVICEAYLEFLKSNGNLERFYQRLGDGGVTRERLEGYERPILSHPDFIPHLKDALIGDFEHFLGILKAVHSGTDLGIAIHSSRYLFDGEMHRLMDFIWHHHNDRKMPPSRLAAKITEARRRIAHLLTGHHERVRDLLFLDIALEDFLRIVTEGNLGSEQSTVELSDLAGSVIENLFMSAPSEELRYVRKHWDRLVRMDRSGREWSLHASSVADRIASLVGDAVDRLFRTLQPKAEFLGRAFQAESWSIDLFSEEVVRGKPVFAMSLVLRYLQPALRKRGRMGDWQVISPGECIAEVEVAETLKSVQNRHFVRQSLLVADKVSGDEEIPRGVVAVITPTAIDILAHLSVRARNSSVLFATCYDDGLIGRLKSLRGRTVKAGIHGGDVFFEESAAGESTVAKTTVVRTVTTRPSFTEYAIPMQEFSEDSVGGKSNHLKQLRGKLPEWINLPASAAVPFGVFEKVMAEEINARTAAEYERLLSGLEEDGQDTTAVISSLQAQVLRLEAPDAIVASLRIAMEKSGLAWPGEWEAVWTCIKKVWASKWNERAYLSRRSNNIPHEDLFMAVLIQSVVEAEYSYVIHTVNPFTGARDEIYAEAVKGLGEALVGNYPGKAFSFICRKGDGGTETLSFPSKREGLFGKGMIFRSDSNGEDLAGFAGAGLYDSFILPAPHKEPLDYTGDLLIWDNAFRKEFSSRVGEIGARVEEALGSPQDIEGACADGQYYVVQTRPQVGLKDE